MRASGALAVAASLAVFASACEKPKPPPPRAELRALTGTTFELVPAEGQLPYCLVFTRSQGGVIRQLTMTHENKSVPCEAGKPIAGVSFRAPVDEGPIKVHIFFSNQKLNAGSIAQQLYEAKGDPSFNPLDLRLPGNVHVQTLDFAPKADGDAEPMLGGEVGAGGQVEPVDEAGTTPDAAADAGTVL